MRVGTLVATMAWGWLAFLPVAYGQQSAAVEALTRSPKYSRIYTDENALQGYQVNRLRRDALARVAHLDERLRLNVGESSVTDQDWNRLRELVKQLGVVWSPTEQQFVRRP